MAVEAASAYRTLREQHESVLSRVLLGLLDEGASTPSARYEAAVAQSKSARPSVAELFEFVDVILTPAAVGEAPADLVHHRRPGLRPESDAAPPSVPQPPLGEGPSKMPVGLQLVGPAGGEAGLLAAAEWIQAKLGDPP